MLIDQWLSKLWQIVLYYTNIAVSAPTHFERHHWIVMLAVALTIGFLSMRGFGSRNNY